MMIVPKAPAELPVYSNEIVEYSTRHREIKSIFILFGA